MTRYLQLLAPPPRAQADAPEQAQRGEELFSSIGCADCHTPSLEGADGPVYLYSDLLLHEILAADMQGIEDASANVREFRTAPLWGLRLSAPYLHDGRADTIADAIVGHAGEADATRARFLDLSDADRAALVTFLETL